MKVAFFFLMGLVVGAAVWAQYPAPSDSPQSGPPIGYPPGGYPPGTRPQDPNAGGIGGSKFPSHNKKKKKGKEAEALPVIAADGLTLYNDGKKLVVKVPDGRTLTMAIDADTKWTRADAPIDASKIVPRTTVHVEVAEEENYDLTVRQVNLLKDAAPPPASIAAPVASAKAAAPVATSEDSDDNDLTASSKILHSPDAPDRPKLRHAKPKPLDKAEPDTLDKAEPDADNAKAVAVSHKTTPPGGSGDMDFTIDDDQKVAPRQSFGSELLDKTTEWSETFMQGLPNYVCQQNTTRYVQRSRGDDWQAQDVISAQVIYVDGHDSYKNIQVDGKKTNKDMMSLGGQTSTGEFGSVLASLFQPTRHTDFTYERTTSIGDTETAIYAFKVALSLSDWHILDGGQLLEPSYSGRIWVDKKTSQIRRIEQRALAVPKDFPTRSVEMAVDYEPVSFGTNKYLVPVRSENIGCQRGSEECDKNVIEWRDYHRYAGESTITFP